MQITSAILGAINNGLNLAFNSQLYAADEVHKPFVYSAPSTGAAEVYPSLGLLPGLREWIGPREANSLTQSQFSIPNRTFEETIVIPRENVEDDKYGMYSVVAQQMGRDAAQQPPLMVAQLLQQGTALAGPDGVPFFGATHPGFDANGKAIQITNTAKVTGNGAVQGPAWYLMDTTQVLKPVIYQTRRPFVLTTKFNLQDPSVFDNNEFTWGIDGRCAAGFGLWQLAFMSTQPLNQTNLIAARTAMAMIRRPNGTPMGIAPDKIVVPTALIARARSLYRSELVANDPTLPTSLTQNEAIGFCEPIEFKWLN